MVKEKSSSISHLDGVFFTWIAAFIFAIVFTAIIWLLSPRLQPFLDSLVPDRGASWYYWKLPIRNLWSMIVVWILYLGHQFAIWAIIWRANNSAKFITPATNGLSNYNWAAIGINLFFTVLHLIETQIWFDGLAQDVPVWTSQYSVIIMLVVILIIENQRRGLFLGRVVKKPFTAKVSGFFRRNHKYLFAWALVYTFWFHPMASDPQLLSGFFYMFLLFTQVSLAYTKVHLVKSWIIILESYVAFHALVVAVYNTIFFGSADMWPMFFSGFAFMFVFTQIYSLKVKRGIFWLLTSIYAIFLSWLYLPSPFGYGRSISYFVRLEFLWIPIILYGLAILFAGITYVYTNSRTE